VEELPRAVATKRHVSADRHSLAKLELSDRLAGERHLRLLTRDEGQVANGAIDDLAVASSLADTRVDDDLRKRRNLVHVGEAEVALQLRRDLVLVLLLQTGRADGRGCAPRDGGSGVSH